MLRHATNLQVSGAVGGGERPDPPPRGAPTVLLVLASHTKPSAASSVACSLAAREGTALRVLAVRNAGGGCLGCDGTTCRGVAARLPAVAARVRRAAVHLRSPLIVLDDLDVLGESRERDEWSGPSSQQHAVVRVAPAPVLALRGLVAPVARDVVVATNFSRASLRAACQALHVARPRRVHLVHVRTPGTPTPRTTLKSGISHAAAHRSARRMLFDAMIATLAISPSIDVTCVTLGGDPAGALLDYLHRVQPDLLTLGRRERGSGSEPGLGPVATELVRRAPCSIYVPGIDSDCTTPG